MISEKFAVDVHGKFGVTPVKAEEGSVGYDIALPADEGPLIMPHNSRRDIDTGVIIRPPEKCFELIVPRSNSYKRGIRISNTVGVIDPSYCGKDDTIIVSMTRDPRKIVHSRTVSLDDTKYDSIAEYCRSELNKGIVWMRDELTPRGCWPIEDEEGLFHIYELPEYTTRVYEPGARFCQALFIPFHRPDLVEKKLEEFSDENRGGYGSTGGV